MRRNKISRNLHGDERFIALLKPIGLKRKEWTMAIILPELSFKKDALEPYISARTLEFHHGKHHAAYVTNANKLIAGTEYETMPEEEIIRLTAGDASKTGIFNNVAQAWNHSFYWKCVTPGGSNKPSDRLKNKIDAAFGGFEKFTEEFKNAAATQFGSGWAWLVVQGDTLKILKTSNADTPIAHGLKPLLTVDVWEHAYYLDYQNRRPDYLKDFTEKLINWDFVASLID